MQPGAYQLASVATTLNALYAAGGLSERGNFREIQIRRNGEVVSTLDLYDYLLRGDTKNDIVLEQGDVVFVPVRGVRASITGAVIRPAIYELKTGQSLANLIEAAGGFAPAADLKRVAVHRIVAAVERAPGPVPRAVVDVGLTMDGGGAPQSGSRAMFRGVAVPPLALEDGDSVVVDSITAGEQSLFVTVAGMVRKPGAYPWREGMTLKELVVLARGPLVGADLREAEVARLPADRSQGELAITLRVPLDSSYLFERDTVGGYQGAAGLAFPPAGSAAEVVLEPFDRAVILKQPEWELQRTVEIQGEVPYPGSYALARKDERISDLVKRAGGLLPTAYPDGAQFVRQMGNAGRVNFDLNQALESPGTSNDIMLQPGDRLTVPEYAPSVRVEGAVNSPASVLYRAGEGLSYYIANAGGYARLADKGRVHVRYADGSARVKSRFLLFSSSPAPGPGSVVTVPSKLPGEPFNLTQLLGSLAQVLASTVAIIVIATQAQP
jgi:protein involved in polysaccharide export with SLBB domain